MGAGCRDLAPGHGRAALALGTGLPSLRGRAHVHRECEQEVRDGFAAHFRHEGIAVDAHDPEDLVLFPEMDPAVDVPEITEGCWDKLGRRRTASCAPARAWWSSARAQSDPPSGPAPCYPTTRSSSSAAPWRMPNARSPSNHPFCAQFCVLGGASCSAS
ncbi:MAG: hypothetical protein U5L11_07615 [Arhodomonas sp.]|nr:hypothetical protein [Arhodomonas sp.]